MAFTDTPISSLRWRVTLAKREQAPNDDGGISDTLTHAQTVHADIQAMGAATFWGATQVEQVSHRIRIRYVPLTLDQSWIVQRERILSDGSTRAETFRVRRVKEVEGRQRFLELECQLEGQTYA